MNGKGVISVAPADGKLLWKHDWASDSIVQPAMTADGDVLLGSGSGMATGVGLLRIGVENGPNGWTTKERWLSDGLNPYFNDFVVHKDHAYGFDGNTITCIDLKNGQLKWEGGRYGHGQMVAAIRPGFAGADIRGRRTRTRESESGSVHRAGAVQGDRRQNVEPSGDRRRHGAGSQQRRDGGVPRLTRKPLTDASLECGGLDRALLFDQALTIPTAASSRRTRGRCPTLPSPHCYRPPRLDSDYNGRLLGVRRLDAALLFDQALTIPKRRQAAALQWEVPNPSEPCIVIDHRGSTATITDASLECGGLTPLCYSIKR